MSQELSAAGASYDIVSFSNGDKTNPYNWSTAKKIGIIAIGSLIGLNSTIASSLPSLASPQLRQHFNVASQEQLVLPNSVYLIGYVVGPTIWAPLSESYGRRWIIITTFIAYTAFMLACALAPNWPAFIIFRFLTGLFGATPISLTGGLFADVLDNPVWRGRSIAWFMVVASFGPAAGPIPSGYLAEISWRWPFWFGLILAGVTIPPVLLLPETFAPALLMSKARRVRRTQPGVKVYAPLELKRTTPRQLITQVLGRPLRMIFAEPIVSACCLYLSLIYGIIFMLFQAYSVIFQPIYNFGQGEVGLAFIPMCIGIIAAIPPCLWYDHVLKQAKGKRKVWASKEEYQRLPLGCFGGPLITIGLFWTGWAARPTVHWIVPMLGGVPFGIGFVLIFVALFNYLVDSYKIYSASALGATSIARSTFGVVLPFAARPMYNALGVAWACSLLGFLSLPMCLIPFAFIRYGPQLREKSPVCKELAQEQAKKNAEVVPGEK
ncbi:hypothetical protein CKM354_000878500 [Cercospora kikuchii]|uniref:Major facilitator superfamily (MFS) profile domain-containing protein n=1 Tax=Cercospora kikuchii TaxID=84275 RepID=A0A9P3CLX5_9PEZI|nr:uncharacterized protein CKM354_000878500 [Cercospora kikuchii]GIZ45627.1 hypothetical protein CKM354_000878500 [Cercospora kikuchii]